MRRNHLKLPSLLLAQMLLPALPAFALDAVTTPELKAERSVSALALTRHAALDVGRAVILSRSDVESALVRVRRIELNAGDAPDRRTADPAFKAILLTPRDSTGRPVPIQLASLPTAEEAASAAAESAGPKKSEPETSAPERKRPAARIKADEDVAPASERPERTKVRRQRDEEDEAPSRPLKQVTPPKREAKRPPPREEPTRPAVSSRSRSEERVASHGPAPARQQGVTRSAPSIVAAPPRRPERIVPTVARAAPERGPRIAMPQPSNYGRMEVEASRAFTRF